MGLTEMLRLLSKNGARGVVRHLAVTPNNDKIIQFFLSDIGEDTKEVVVKEWFVTEGQEIEEFDELVEVQSDKATVPITSRWSARRLLIWKLKMMAMMSQLTILNKKKKKQKLSRRPPQAAPVALKTAK